MKNILDDTIKYAFFQLVHHPILPNFIALFYADRYIRIRLTRPLVFVSRILFLTGTRVAPVRTKY